MYVAFSLHTEESSPGSYIWNCCQSIKVYIGVVDGCCNGHDMYMYKVVRGNCPVHYEALVPSSEVSLSSEQTLGLCVCVISVHVRNLHTQ